MHISMNAIKVSEFSPITIIRTLNEEKSINKNDYFFKKKVFMQNFSISLNSLAS
jgi:hypothetical protein